MQCNLSTLHCRGPASIPRRRMRVTLKPVIVKVLQKKTKHKIVTKGRRTMWFPKKANNIHKLAIRNGLYQITSYFNSTHFLIRKFLCHTCLMYLWVGPFLLGPKLKKFAEIMQKVHLMDFHTIWGNIQTISIQKFVYMVS